MRLRLMQPDDLDPIMAEMLADGWGDRRRRFEFYLSRECCRVFVAEADGAVVATGMASLNGGIAWLGETFVFRGHRGGLLAKALFDARLRFAADQGSRSQLLASVEASRPLAARYGFAPAGTYHVFEGPPLLTMPSRPDLRPVDADDEPLVYALDREATGEDRSALLRPFVRAGWVVTDGPGRLRGYHLRTSWGQGPVIARDPEAGRMLLDVKRALCGAAGSARIGIPLANEAALAYLQAPGFRCTMVETRGVRGAPVDWRPEWIWGQFNGSLG